MTSSNGPSTPNNAVKNQNNQHFIKHIFELIYCEAGLEATYLRYNVHRAKYINGS
ncbi:hypothetical protein HanXRQr2_Chr16g0749701 [Helianthus annuus]|uniref:Uncharacterized protein n=1 Tax=Helianthus annuus TaxID=4232 RepID=A0A9K3DSE9_HELAN|nr:hypothetical protein HanXRQr2_Chr16g0749701 [Helianthus annuus]